MTAGRLFRETLAQHSPLQIVGVINAITAKLAAKQQHHAIYLSGAGVANAQFALPDLGLVDMSETLTEVRRITAACDLPLVVDIDSGGGQPLLIKRWIVNLIAAGAAACHIEDQQRDKRCGHREKKRLCSVEEMVVRLETAVKARSDKDFFIIARTDVYAVEGLAATVARAQAYIEAGADAIFAEALPSLAVFTQFRAAISKPLLANMTEFGKTTLFTCDEAKEANIDMLLYPLTAFRCMNQAAEFAYQTLKEEGDQSSLLDNMQTRQALYTLLDYPAQEQCLDDYYQLLDGE